MTKQCIRSFILILFFAIITQQQIEKLVGPPSHILSSSMCIQTLWNSLVGKQGAAQSSQLSLSLPFLSTNNSRVAAYLIQTAECSSRNFLILWLATKILAKHGHEIQSQYCSGLGRVSGQDRVKCRWSVSLTLTIEHDVLNYWTKQWKKWLQIRVTGSLQAVRKHLLALIWQWRASVSMTRDRQAAFFSTLFDDRTPRTTFVGQRMETWGIN